LKRDAMEAIEVVKYALPAILTLLGSFILYYLREIRDRAREARQLAAEVGADLGGFKTEVTKCIQKMETETARTYVTKDEFVTQNARLEAMIESGFGRLSDELRGQRESITQLQQAVARSDRSDKSEKR
jgi:uncharacterized coiled-coil DUF342 family protein